MSHPMSMYDDAETGLSPQSQASWERLAHQLETSPSMVPKLSEDANELISYAQNIEGLYLDAERLTAAIASKVMPTESWRRSRWIAYFMRVRSAYRADLGSGTGYHFAAPVIKECAVYMDTTAKQEGAY